MNTALVIFILALITIAIVRSKLAANASNMPKAQPTPTGSGQTVASLLQAGEKIQAIKLYREQTGAGLRDAKDAVEAMARGEAPPRATMPSANSATLENLIRAGRKIEAIKLYREQTGAGLKDAKDHVEALTQQLLLR